MKIKSWINHEKTAITKHINLKDRHVTAYLQKNTEPTSIHCMFCKKRLFDTQMHLYQIEPGSPPDEIMYIKVRCPNLQCNTYWYFVSTV